MIVRKLTGGEVLGATAVCWLAAVVVPGYFADFAGVAIAARPILALSIAAAVAIFFWLQLDAEWRALEIAAITAVTGITLGWLLWLAWPAWLPPGGGADLAHHLQLVDYIDRHASLVHDPTVEWYMGEMVHYTPGAHLAASVLGRAFGSDGFHAIYLVIAVSVAIKSALVFLIAQRTVAAPSRAGESSGAGPDSVASAFGILAVVLLFLPLPFFVGSFIRFSYLAQVVSEMFAIAMWWALVVSNERPSVRALFVFALAGVGSFLTWPIWVGPPLVVLALTTLARKDRPLATNVTAFAIGSVPVAIVAAIHAAGRLGWTRIVRTDANMPLPAWSDFTPWFIILAIAGVPLVAWLRRGRVTALFLIACAAQALALFTIAKLNGAVVPYMAVKMLYLAIYPLAVAGAFAVTTGWRAATRRAPSRFSQALAWSLVLVVAIVVGRETLATPKPKAIVSESLYEAGEWARAHVDAACVDYIVPVDDAAYWLHLSVLGNRRMSDRTADDRTFARRDAIVRWINPGGLPYAVADLGTIPKDVLESTDELARFGSAVVIKRRGDSRCTP